MSKVVSEEKDDFLVPRPKKTAVLYANVAEENKRFLERMSEKLNRPMNEILDRILEIAREDEEKK